jgi:hypothetical protein
MPVRHITRHQEWSSPRPSRAALVGAGAVGQSCNIQLRTILGLAAGPGVRWLVQFLAVESSWGHARPPEYPSDAKVVHPSIGQLVDAVEFAELQHDADAGDTPARPF